MEEKNLSWQLVNRVPKTPTPLCLRQLLGDYWGIPRRVIGSLRQHRSILVDGNHQPLNVALTADQLITLNLSKDAFITPKSRYIADNSRVVPILFENRDLLVVNKPQGIKTHPNAPNECGTVMNFIQAQLAARTPVHGRGWQQDNFVPHAYMVHRLDQQTSGAMLVAKHPLATSLLVKQMATKQISREYLALVYGRMGQTSGTITLPIGQDEADCRKRKVNGKNAKFAQTLYTTLFANEVCSLVHLKLTTGRTHQLRVHLAAMGHPIVGDPLYAAASAANLPAATLMLHGLSQRFLLPFSNEPKTIVAPLPQRFYQWYHEATHTVFPAAALEKLGLNRLK